MISHISTCPGNSRRAEWKRFTSRSSPGSCVAVPEQLWPQSRVIEFIARKWRSHAKVGEKRERILKLCAVEAARACSNADCTVAGRIKFVCISNILDIRRSESTRLNSSHVEIS